MLHYLLGSHHHIIKHSLMKVLLESLSDVVSSMLLCNGLESLPCKYFATQTSKNAVSRSEAVL